MGNWASARWIVSFGLRAKCKGCPGTFCKGGHGTGQLKRRSSTWAYVSAGVWSNVFALVTDHWTSIGPLRS